MDMEGGHLGQKMAEAMDIPASAQKPLTQWIFFDVHMNATCRCNDGVRSSLPGFRRVLQRVLRNGAQGADTVLWLAATRPEPSSDGGVWLDRHRDTEHAFAMTRGGASAEALVAGLQQRLHGIQAAHQARSSQ